MMVNGLPVTSNFVGSGLWAYNAMSMDMVQRIEIIRGPASSLYGANAFSGIINVITRKGAEIDGVELIQKFGSDDMTKSTMIFGDTFKSGLELSGYIDFLEEDGYSGILQEDRQSQFDKLFGSSASKAPGPTDNEQRKLELGGSLKFNGLFLDLHWIDRERGPNVGMFDALGDSSLLDQRDGFVNLGYNWEVNETLTITPNVYYHYNYMGNRTQFLPQGTTFPNNIYNPTGTVTLPLGMESFQGAVNTREGGEIRADWLATDRYKMVFGLTYEKMRQKDLEHKGNYYFETDGDLIVLPGEQETPAEFYYNRRVDRTFRALYLENLFDLTDSLRLTLGGRYDSYSDFGDSFNPRASIIWEFAKGYELKLLYGRAFLAPSFYQLYNTVPLINGNPNLDPETIDSFEATLAMKPLQKLSMQFTYFHNTIKDTIVETYQNPAIIFDNTEETVVDGFESEARYDLGRGSYLAANYTYQHSYDKGTNARVGKVPMHYAHLAANFRLNRQINWHSSINWQSAPNIRKEDKADGYKGFGESYAIVNTGLTIKDICPSMENIEFRAFVYNLFDKKYFTDYSGEIPYGVPAPGRQFMVELKITF
jgi:iron complex outermembrane receptor protein